MKLFDKHNKSITALVDVSEAMLNAMEKHTVNLVMERILDQKDLDLLLELVDLCQQSKYNSTIFNG